MRLAPRPGHLNRFDRAVLDTLLPAGAHPALPRGVLETGFDAFLADLERDAPARLRRAFRLGLFAAGWVAPLLVRRAPPLSRLAAADRERALEAMERSRFAIPRQLLSVLKTVVALHYGALDDVRRAIGYGA